MTDAAKPNISFTVDGNMGYEFGEVDYFAEEAIEILQAARAEINRWGHGDMHYGPTARDPKVLAMLARIDDFLESYVG